MQLNLKHNLKFTDLYEIEGLKLLDTQWLHFLNNSHPELYLLLLDYRNKQVNFGKEQSELIISLASCLEDFIADLFGILPQVSEVALQHNKLAPIYKCKRLFIQRQAARAYNDETLNKLPSAINTLQSNDPNFDQELNFAVNIAKWEEEKNLSLLDAALTYAAWAVNHIDGQNKHKNGVLFKLPKKLDSKNLASLIKDSNGCYTGHQIHERNGFSLTDQSSLDTNKALDNANYCIHCHKQGKDSCSKGFKDADTFKVNEQKVTLAGCPLEEKISEMNLLKSQGSIIGAFAVVLIDNPMAAATGHRICNDCMKACIYQKQEPVDIPLVETNVLNSVLELPWGFEIYSLLTRWNPLKNIDYLPKPITDKKVLVAGLGPAGFTLSHYLINEGFTVIGIDGLKIEPLASELSGIDLIGNRYNFKPIYDVKNEVYEDLELRKAYGFGGVAEYGITVRWNKNYLTLIRLLLERRKNFRMFGGIRFGSNITYQTCKNLGFDHLALAFGAGKPNLLGIPNGFAKGVKTASDFLMSLQSTGSARKDSLANLQIQLPVIVIGGGLTAIDTATESLAYYPIQVEKFLNQFESIGEQFLNQLTPEEQQIALEFIDHAKQFRKHPNKKLSLLKSWGGVKVVYRKSIQDSPAYRLNHEEVEKALSEGIEFIENATPLEIKVDEFNACKEVVFDKFALPAKTLLIAAGTQPNTILAHEDKEHFTLHGNYFRAIDDNKETVQPQKVTKPKQVNVIHSIDNDKFSVSFFGDLHPSYAGNVVKAMASAKQGYKSIVRVLEDKQASSSQNYNDFYKKLDAQFIATVEKVIRLTPKILEIIVKAPLAANQFQPGQFYRLQNFEALALRKDNITFAMEGIALTGASVDKEKGILSMIVLEMGGSSNLCQYLKTGEPVVLMGPTGTPTEIPKDETVMLVGGGLGNAVLFSIGQAMKQNNCKVLYFAGYKEEQDRYKIEEIEKASDITVWCCDEKLLSKNRIGDKCFKGNIVAAMQAYGDGSLGATSINLNEIDRIITIGSDKMMAAVAFARHNQLKDLFKTSHVAIGSINSPMQCMMKEICGQCIQRHVDPKTGLETYVYSCYNQDQMLDCVDFKHLSDRLAQNSLQEKLCSFWIRENLKSLA